MLNQIISKVIREATSDGGGSRGSYVPPMQPGIRPFSKESLAPFNQSVSDYKSPLVQYDSYDHTWDLRSGQIRELEKTAAKIQDYIKKHPYSTFSDEDGNPINQFMKNGFNPNIKEKMQPYTQKVQYNEWVEVKPNVIYEIHSSTSAGEYSGPQELGLRKWTGSELGAFMITADTPINNDTNIKNVKGNIRKTIGGWEPREGNDFDIPTYDVPSEKEIRVQSNGEIITDPMEWYKNFKSKKKPKKEDPINEDLAVWFGTKKKPKGSSQPKGPWVNICRKVDGKHPPCGRPDTSKGGYPKCRAAGVASKMSDSAKKSACSQKRSAEKKDTQTGKGQKPVMTSYKPKNESVDQIIGNVLLEIRNSI
jgi:hypothetical protein